MSLNGAKEFLKEHKAAAAANVAVTGAVMAYDVANNPASSYLARAFATVATSAVVGAVQAGLMYGYNRFVAGQTAAAPVVANDDAEPAIKKGRGRANRELRMLGK